MRDARIAASFVSVVALLFAAAREVSAAPSLRVQVSQRGDFVLLGNTLGFDCAAGVPAPVVGTVAGPCGNGAGDSAPDVYWRSDAPLAGQAQANSSVFAANARSTAVLELPDGATVTHAFLYWGATRDIGTDLTVTLERPNTFASDVAAGNCLALVGDPDPYHCWADVTTLVHANGEGAYRVSGVGSTNFIGVDNNTTYAGWWMVVLYELPTDPLRSLAVFDGLDVVDVVNPQEVIVSGFLVPDGVSVAKLGAVAFDGDATIDTDQLFFGGGGPLGDAQNPANNFFNATRSSLGMPVSVPGDLPQLTGTPASMSGIDLDVVDVTGRLDPGETSTTIQVTSTNDVVHLVGFVTSIGDTRPHLTTSKFATDLNAGLLVPGDVLEYAIATLNTGNDSAIDVVVTDALPAGVTYVPGSLEISDGPNAGAKTDGVGDDQAEYDANTNTLTFRIGTGADATTGGVIDVDASSEIRFQVTIDPDTLGIVGNQAIITAGGGAGAPPFDTPSDGNGAELGAPPTTVFVDQCETDVECSDPGAPVCDVAPDPNLCVQCVDDGDCSDLLPTCDVANHACVCIPDGLEVCDGDDNDCNGTIDDDFPVGDACSVGIGECATEGAWVCTGDGMDVACLATPGEPSIEMCDGLDNDCNDLVDDDCIECDMDVDCGAIDSGVVCDATGMCIDGCRGVGGNGCPVDFECTSMDDTIGMCVGTGDTTSSGGSESSSGTSDTGDSTSTGEPGTESGETSTSVGDSGTESADGTTSSSTTEGADGSSGDATISATAGVDDTTDGATSSDSVGSTDEGGGCGCSTRSDGRAGLALLLLLGVRTRRRRIKGSVAGSPPPRYRAASEDQRRPDDERAATFDDAD